MLGRLVLVGLCAAIASVPVQVSGTFVFVKVVDRNPAIGNPDANLGCYPAAFTGEDRSLSNIESRVANPETACTSLQGTYTDRVVVVKRGGCTFKTKVRNAQAAGATAIIVVNDEPDFPVQMRLSEGKTDPDARYDDETIERNGVGIPVCMAFNSAWEVLAGQGVSGVRLSFEDFRKYLRGSERLPENDITMVAISQADGTFHEVPAAQATFNPVVGEIVADAEKVELDAKCKSTSTCDACWDLNQQISNHADLDGKVAVFHLDPGVQSCMSWMFEITVLVQKAGATALIYVNADETLWTWIPWLVPFDVSIPTFNVLRSDGKTVLGRLALDETLQIKTPVLQHFPSGCRPNLDACIASGPRFREGSTTLPLTALLFVDYTEDEKVTRLTTAGQALFNPLELSASDSAQSYFALHAPVAVTYFPDKCSLDVAIEGGDGACGPCQDDVEVMSKMGSLQGRVALILEADVGCVGSWQTIVEGATALGAEAVVFGTDNDQIGSLTASTQFRSAIPAFVIAHDDAEWLHDRAERFSDNPWDAPTRRSDLEGVVGFVPQIEGGSAPAYHADYALASFEVLEQETLGQDPGPAPSPPPTDGVEEDPVRLTRLTIMEEEDQYVVTAAVASFMSPTYPSAVGDAVWLHWWYCASLDTCGACASLTCEDIKNRQDLRGKIALIWDHDIPCFGTQDAVTAAYCAQDYGAAGVVFVSDSSVSPMPPAEQSLPSHMLPTTCMDGRYRAFCMPVFSVSGIAAIKLRNYVTCASAKDGERMACQSEVSANPAVRIELPGHHNNPSPFGSAGINTGDGYLSTADESKGTKRELPPWGIAVIVLAVVFAMVACAFAVVRKRRRRAAAMASATQEVTQSMIEDDDVDEGAVVIEADPTRFRPGYAEPVEGLASEAPFDPKDYAKSKLGFPKGESGKNLTENAASEGVPSPSKPGPAGAALETADEEPEARGSMEEVDVGKGSVEMKDMAGGAK